MTQELRELGEKILKGEVIINYGNVFNVIIGCCGACQACIGGRGFIYEQINIGWIKAANCIGKYRRTYLGFRIYKTKDEFFICIHKRGDIIKGKDWDSYISQIDRWHIENVIFKTT